MIIIEVKDLLKSYNQLKAVNEISFSVQKGEIFGLLGPNGAGKTTTLNLIEGILDADAGEIQDFGLNHKEATARIKKRIGVQLQSTSLIPNLSAREQIILFSKLYDTPMSPQEAVDLLANIGLQDKRNTLPGKMSGGQRQRLSLALALINRPEIIFLDEPTNGLDPQSRRWIWNLIKKLQSQGKTIIITTHYIEEAEALCHRVGIIDHGKLIALDTPISLINQLKDLTSITCSGQFNISRLKSLDKVEKVVYAGKMLQIQTKHTVETLTALLNYTRDNGIILKDIHIKQPTLEDVFLRLTGRAIRD